MELKKTGNKRPSKPEGGSERVGGWFDNTASGSRHREGKNA